MAREIRRMDDDALLRAYVVGDLANPERWGLISQEIARRGLLWRALGL